MPKHMYELEELIGFGNFLLTPERRDMYENHPDAQNMPPIDDRTGSVTLSDLQFFFGQIAPGN